MLTYFSGDNDGNARDRRAVLASQAFLDQGDTEFHYGFLRGYYVGVWVDGRLWTVIDSGPAVLLSGERLMALGSMVATVSLYRSVMSGLGLERLKNQAQMVGILLEDEHVL